MTADTRARRDADAYTSPQSPKQSPALVSLEAEQSVLGGLLLDNGAFDRVGNLLLPEHFASDEHRTIWSAINRMAIANKPIDVFTVFEELRAAGWSDSMQYLNALAMSVPSAANCQRYAEIVIDRFKARQLMKVGTRAVEIAQDAQTPIDERIEQMQGEIGRLSEQAAQRDAVPLGEAIARELDALQDRLDGKVRVFPTGLDDLDRILGGGIRPGNLVIVAARPSMGKTALALTMALEMAKDLGVGFLSMEMSESELSMRTLSGLSHVNLADVQRPANARGDFWERLSEGAELASRRNLFVDDQGGLTLHQVTAKARNMRRKHGIDVLIVDYLQMMNGTDPRASRAYQLEEITRGLKGLAKSLGIAVVALAQVNRKVEGGMPGLSDLKDSGAIEQDADIVTFIHRPIHADPDLGDEWRYFAKLRCAKNRQGPTGDVSLTYIGHETRFANWSGAEPVKAARGRNDL